MFEQKMLFYKLFSGLKIIGAIKDRDIRTSNLTPDPFTKYLNCNIDPGNVDV